MLPIMKLCVASIVLLTITPASAQDNGNSKEEMPSRTEQMISESEKEVLLGWIELGSTTGTGSVSVNVLEYRFTEKSRKILYAVSISISSENKSRASRIVDEDEISSLIKIIKDFRDSDFRSGSTIDSKAYTGSFSTRSGLSLRASQFYDSTLKSFTLSALPNGGVSAEFKSTEIDRLLELITKAETAIKEARRKS